MNLKLLISFIKKYYGLILILAVFGAIYSLIGIVNHYQFRTGTYDLGINTNALYDYLRLSINDSFMIDEVRENLLAYHFDLYLVLISPLSLIFGSYTLIVFQIVAILTGGIGIHKLLTYTTKSRSIPLLATLQFFLFFGIYSSIAFDYHSNVIAAMILPWFIYYFRIEWYSRAFFFLFLMLIANEFIGIWLVFVCIGMMFMFWRNSKAMSKLFVFGLVSYLYFMLVSGIIMPRLSTTEQLPLFEFSSLGKSLPEVISFLFRKPYSAAKVLLINQVHDPAGHNLKEEFHLFIILSGGILLLFRPQYLLMLIPVYFVTMFNDNVSMWSPESPYTVCFAPIVTIGAFSFINDIEQRKTKMWVAVFTILFTMGITYKLMTSTQTNTDNVKLKFFEASYFNKLDDVEKVHQYLGSIPRDAVVSTQEAFLPHLALRDHIYTYPAIYDANYVIISEDTNVIPEDSNRMKLKIQAFKSSDYWDTEVEDEGFYIFKLRE